jgi:AraC-like DNA-binding protein
LPVSNISSLYTATRSPRSVALARTRVGRLLNDRAFDEVTAGDLADVCGASRFTVCRTFHAACGMAPSDYQRRLRLRAARRLIADGRSIGEVAARTGFADQSHLTRWFTRCSCLTPGAYRAALRS